MSSVKPDTEPSRIPVEEAARWFLLLQEESVGAEKFLDWQRWIFASSAHRLAYEQIEDTALRLARSTTKPPLPSADELARDTYDGSRPIADWNVIHASDPVKYHEPQSRWPRYAIAAGLGIVSLAGMFLWLQQRDVTVGALAYRTAPGQRQVVELPEGSTITLDADSALNVQLKPDSRALTLEHGEAYFEVAKDQSRPFVVRAGTTEVTAVGTAFNVRMSENRTVVAVTEGKVEVLVSPQAGELPANGSAARTLTTPRLAAQVSAGEAVSYIDDGNLQALPAAEAPLATTWLQGRRQYRNEPLRYVLADVDRYTGRKIEITGEATELRFTGTLDLENSEAWLRGLAVALPVEVTEREDGTLSITMHAAQ